MEPSKRFKAELRYDWDKSINVFTLTLDAETITLEPGQSWDHLDRYKWAARGLSQPPRAFQVLPDGSVEINSQTISPEDPEGLGKLEEQLRRRADASTESATLQSAPSSTHPRTPGKARYKVKLDHWGHLLIECFRGEERVEASLKGFPGLIANGLILKPNSFQLDPLYRSVEIDGVRFECNAAGAQQLETALNARYAPNLSANQGTAIEIRENLAATTGFDIRFPTLRSGQRVEVKGHLTQENLDLLQDPVRCDLLQPGILMRLSPPFILIRRRRPDGGEEKIPGLPDVHYRQITAVELEQIFNHPSIRKGASAAHSAVAPGAAGMEELVEIRVARNPENPALLWLEGVSRGSGKPERKAFTHHNIAELLHRGVFLQRLDVSLSLDRRRLGILDKQSGQEESITLDTNSGQADLVRAGQMLTKALKPPSAPGEPPEPNPQLQPELFLPAVEISQAAATPEALGTTTVKIETASPCPPPSGPSQDSGASAQAQEAKPAAQEPPVAAIFTLFDEPNSARINIEIFRRLAAHFGIASQDVRFSLPCVFENRRFEIISLEQKTVGEMMELRAEGFYGFYLIHVKETKVILVHACNGAHIEWGPDKCLLQPSTKAEADTFKGSGLLGMAQDLNDQFVFIVRPEFQEWLKPREKPFAEQNMHFITVQQLASAPDKYIWIWPQRPNKES